MSVEELAQDNDMPTWQVAETMVRLMQKELVAAPDNATVDDHAAWLTATYPKPRNVIEESAKPKTTPYQRGHDAACRSGEYFGADKPVECPYPGNAREAAAWMEGHRDGTKAMHEAWSRYD